MPSVQTLFDEPFSAHSLMPDPLALVMIALTLFVALVVAGFSRVYMRADPGLRRFGRTLVVLIACVLVVVTTHNLVALAIAWVGSGVLLARLIGHDRGWAEARGAARRAQVAFAIGDLALIVALALLGHAAGSADLGAVTVAAPTMPAGTTTVAALLLLVAAAARCALPPFSGWLLSSMTAPTPVSALMHAGLVNAGGLLLIRFGPVLECAPAARVAAVVVGLAAAILGAGVMVVRPDVKRALAGSTVSQMGFMIISCGLGAYAAALWHIVAHGMFKAWLFLGSGSTIGMKPRAMAPGPRADRTTLAIATITLGTALALVAGGQASANLVPLLLGLATALATLGTGLRASPHWGDRAVTGALVAGLIGGNVLGLALCHAVLGADAPTLLSTPALIALIAGFLGVWAWQAQRRALPAAIYVHLINSGALNSARAGDA
ncbi:proton-conducting transporter membrane subunit [Novosphingobium sp.]|uniref:proton-conducting transporter transmembrane domain-containing protein n=1 Tax=Novosphingobium sp. TaxID=1874826 RepID=UPI00334031B8